VISILLGVTALYNTGLTYGGTVSFTWGWLLCGFLNLLVGAAMAEVIHSSPSSEIHLSDQSIHVFGMHCWTKQGQLQNENMFMWTLTDLLSVSHVWWTLLLELSAGNSKVEALRFVDHRLVIQSSPLLSSLQYFICSNCKSQGTVDVLPCCIPLQECAR
jgi:hypothetical protein